MKKMVMMISALIAAHSAFAAGLARPGAQMLVYSCHGLNAGPDNGTGLTIVSMAGPDDRQVFVASLTEETIAGPRPLLSEKVDSLSFPQHIRVGSENDPNVGFRGPHLELLMTVVDALHPIHGRVVAEVKGRRIVEELECTAPGIR